MILLSGNSNKPLSNSVAKVLRKKIANKEIKRFQNGELIIKGPKPLQNECIAIIQSTPSPVHKNFMELLFLLDQTRQQGARNSVAVLPYFSYARQSSLAQTIASLLQASGATQIITLDLHTKEIEACFDIPVQNIQPTFIIEGYIRRHFNLSTTALIAPDQGAFSRVKELAKKLSLPFARLEKKRDEQGTPHITGFIGDVAKKDCVILDDMVDTARTLCNATQALKEHGAKTISAYATHGIFSKGSHRLIKESALESLMVTDSIEISKTTKSCPKIRQISIAPLIAAAIEASEEASFKKLYTPLSTKKLF
ncbi:MAG TPA: phosphoribosylpyrophosphate synthetase [Holosporales bacterium]|nr:phosphoribosylpyrophosphate synthetase [Holosporales bacterium]